MNSDRLMRNMMQSMGMGIPFGMFDTFGGGGGQGQQQMPHNPLSSMIPHGFMSPMSMMVMNPFQGMQQAMSLANNGSNGGFSYCSSSVTNYTFDEQGRPQVYQQSSEVKSGPNGVRETKSAVRDSRTGHQELAIGHHLHEKAHIKKKSKNVYTGEEEQAEDFLNIDEDETESFEQNWSRQARNITPSSYNNQLNYSINNHGRSSRNNRLALASSAQEDLMYLPPTHRPHASSSNTTDKSAMKTKKKKKSSKEARV